MNSVVRFYITEIMGEDVMKEEVRELRSKIFALGEIRPFYGIDDRGIFRGVSKEVQQELIKDEEYPIREVIAASKETPEELLETLSRDESRMVRERVAQNPNTPTSTLEKLSYDMKASEVRASVAESQKVSTETLHRLSKDRSPIVRMRVINNYKTSEEVLLQMLNDTDDEMRAIVVSKLISIGKLETADLSEILKAASHDESYKVRKEAAES